MGPAPKFITFDCYGTLVQWHHALQTAVRLVLASRAGPAGVDEDEANATVDALRVLAMARQQRVPYVDYETVLRSSLAKALTTRGLSPRPNDGDTLLSLLRAVPPHPEVPVALQRLRERFRLAIISNTDDALIAGTVDAIGVPIDVVVTAEHARAYKPDHQLFRRAHAVMGVTPAETLHVGMGQVTDLKVCREMGIRAVWINRTGEPLNPAWAPDATLPDLSGLPGLLANTPDAAASRVLHSHPRSAGISLANAQAPSKGSLDRSSCMRSGAVWIWHARAGSAGSAGGWASGPLLGPQPNAPCRPAPPT